MKCIVQIIIQFIFSIFYFGNVWNLYDSDTNLNTEFQNKSMKSEIFTEICFQIIFTSMPYHQIYKYNDMKVMKKYKNNYIPDEKKVIFYCPWSSSKFIFPFVENVFIQFFFSFFNNIRFPF